MKVRLTPYYIQLVYDACLKSFWRRKTLTKFLRHSGVSDKFLATWSADETKRDLLDRLFDSLPGTDKGREALLRMSSFLMEQKSFPDLAKWEDSAVKIKDAHDAVQRLRLHHEKQQEEIQSEQDRGEARRQFVERQKEISRSQATLQSLSERLNALGRELGTAEAGYKFQDWFYDLAQFSEVAHKRPYVHAGRQIDGSITISGTTYLVELKFTSEQADATDIDTFFRKVTSKADNTMGIMVSISGYSSVARSEASGDRTPLLLVDHGHLFLILGGVMSLTEVVDRVRRHASQTGEAYLAALDFGK